MKKHLVLILFIVICVFMFSACGSSNSQTENSEQETETHELEIKEEYTNLKQEEIEEQTVCKVHISINPEFELRLDKDGKIISVICLNQDAKDLYPDLMILDIPYDVGFQLILEHAIAKNYLTNTSQVMVEVNGAKGSLDQSIRDWVSASSTHVIGQMIQTSGIQFTVDLIIENQQLVLDNLYPKYEKEYDSNGNLIKETTTFEDGTISILCWNSEGLQISYEHYTSDGTLDIKNTRVYLSTSPMVYTETDIHGEEREITCDMDGNEIFVAFHSGSGDFFEEWYDNHILYRIRVTFTDGLVKDEEYENGIKVKETVINPIGYVETFTFVDGIIVQAIREEDNGDIATIEYLNGMRHIENGTRPDGTTWVVNYNNDVKTRYYWLAPDGSYTEQLFHENGLLIYEDYYYAPRNEKSISEFTVGANGLYTYYKNVGNDGVVYEVWFDSNGVSESWRNTYPNGRIENGIFDAEGRPVLP